MAAAEPSPELTVPDVEAWRLWLSEHHGGSDGVWLVLAKKGTTTPTTLSYAEALDEALCNGWIRRQAGRHPCPPHRAVRRHAGEGRDGHPQKRTPG